MTTNLWIDNTPSSFWRLLTDLTPGSWESAVVDASNVLEFSYQIGNVEQLTEAVLGEGQFGPGVWRLSGIKQLYYQIVRPFLPSFFRPLLRKFIFLRKKNNILNWPIEDRFVRFQFEVIKKILEKENLHAVKYIHFWPYGKRFAFVLTHDVEGVSGYDYIWDVVALEEKYGFRSSFNFVPEAYQVNLQFVEELQERGFEVGVHGLKHDGKLFSSRRIFNERCRKINAYAKKWRSVGFRSPMTHRNPEWMQSLDIEYDLSFFDTDPYEPMPGGTMSIWPFCLGQFIELPYTLAQDHTLMVTLGEKTPKLWLEKVDFIKRYCGMALVNTHPDYLREECHLSIYEEFLHQVRAHGEYWHALPREVARWWRRRKDVLMEPNSLHVAGDVVIGSIRKRNSLFEETSSNCPVELIFSSPRGTD